MNAVSSAVFIKLIAFGSNRASFSDVELISADVHVRAEYIMVRGTFDDCMSDRNDVFRI